VVNDYIEAHSFDFVADSMYIRQFEKDNRDRIMESLSRDKKQPFSLKLAESSTGLKGGGQEYITLYDIFQDGVLLGQVEKHVIKTMNFGSKAYYVIWKRTIAPYAFEGKTMKFGILAYIETDSPTFDQELVLMSDKSKLRYKTTDHTNDEYKIVHLLVTNGIL
jgi:hypothetical protein